VGDAVSVAVEEYDGYRTKERSYLIGAADGSALGSLAGPTGRPLFLDLVGQAAGLIGSEVTGESAGMYDIASYSLTACLGRAWTFPGGRGHIALAIHPGDQLLVAERERGSRAVYITRYSAGGSLLAGPAAMPPVTDAAIGADGTAYLLTMSADEEGSTCRWGLTAVSSSLGVQWRLDLGSPCGWSRMLLADDGRLYLARSLEAEGGVIELIIVRTASPGLADSSWPMTGHDNRGTWWLAP
jgi:hypothetical protein